MNNFDKKNWQKFKFGDIAKEVRIAEPEPLKNGLSQYVGLEHIESENLHIKSWGDIADGTTFTRKFVEGQVLFGRRRAYLKKAALANFDGICSGDILVFEAIKDKLLSELLPFIVQNDKFFQYAVDASAGSLSPRVKFKDLAKFELMLPESLDEQKKLADLLWAGDELEQKYQQLNNALKNTYLITLQKLTKKKENIRKLGEVVEILDSQRKPLNSKQRDKISGSIPYYGANGQVDSINDFIFDEDLILIAEDGGNFFEYLDKPIAYKISGKSWVNNHAHVLKPKEKLIYFDWLFFSLVHKNITSHVVGTTRYKLNQGELKNLKIHVPSLKTQEIYIKKLKNIVEAISISSPSEISKINNEVRNSFFS